MNPGDFFLPVDVGIVDHGYFCVSYVTVIAKSGEATFNYCAEQCSEYESEVDQRQCS